MVDRYFSLFRIYSYIPREEEGDVFHLDSPGGGSRQRSIISPALSPHGSQGQLISDQFVIMTLPHPPRPSVSRPKPVTSSHRTPHTAHTADNLHNSENPNSHLPYMPSKFYEGLLCPSPSLNISVPTKTNT